MLKPDPIAFAADLRDATMQSLLAQGRELLAQKQRDQEAAEAARVKEVEGLFAKARAVIVPLFAPIEERRIEPQRCPDGWSPANNHTFWIRPFAAGRIQIETQGHYRYTGGADDAGTWDFEVRKNKAPFHVEYGFRANEEGDDAYGSINYEVETLAEAIALCEQQTKPYHDCIAGAAHAAERAEQARSERVKRRPTPSEALLEALENWHAYMSAE